MKIENNKVVSLTYRLSENDENGALIEEVKSEQPFVFLFGGGNLIEGFEKNVRDLGVGDNFAFSVASADAYGEYNEEHIADLPIEIFLHEGKLDNEMVKVGNVIPLRDEQGHQFNGVVKKIGLETITMDFNHPMAGKNLYFKGEVVDVRDATEEELSHGHVHGPHGHKH